LKTSENYQEGGNETMRRENKKFWSNGYTFLIYFSILFTLLAFSSAEATTFVTLTPDSLPANDPGTTELTADTTSPDNTVWVDLFIDANKDGIIDTEEARVMSFSLTDGTGSPEIAGVTNTNVNGDEDTVDSSITTTLKFYSMTLQCLQVSLSFRSQMKIHLMLKLSLPLLKLLHPNPFPGLLLAMVHL
jgi:hypothetical protein